MGLDQYAFARSTPFPDAVDFRNDERHEEEHLYYWRKHPDLHGWMFRLYKEKGGKEDKDGFNCVSVELTAADLDRLEQDVIAGKLPATSGFFFGASSHEDRADDLAFITKAREAIASGKFVRYDSWWLIAAIAGAKWAAELIGLFGGLAA